MDPQKRSRELAVDIVSKLVEAGFIAYFAGGFVRDLLLGKEPTEIDIATSASPEQVMSLFPKTLAVGIAFGVVIVVIGQHQFEVATFRYEDTYLDGRHPSYISFSSAQEDAQRRDFTINGMFYDPLTENIYDFVGGQQDLKLRLVRAIGSAKDRFAEDRLRMLRAVRFATRLGFRIEEHTAKAIQLYASSLFPSVSMERIWQELSKMAEGPRPEFAFIMLHRLGLLATIFPDLHELSLEDIEKRVAHFSYYPQQCPAIFYVHAVVPEMGIKVCQYLKTSNRDIKLLETLLNLPKDTDLVAWAHYYALPAAWLCLEVLAASSQDPSFLKEHEKRKQHLHLHIERITKKKPLVCAQILQEHGILPGPNMGELLRQAERIAIEHNLEDHNEILKRLNIS
ncbi:MAG: CCA tRNA nucleotidyltransferase [Verrucomicrobia bacterium]|nr:CCA tRNA nucleotidyltransferase [Verrucomicrobiota bacterium]MBS0645484.1 CCA tRNA nucleotidyltransferase [Verrucomicrobiota bacterium]